MWRCWREYTQIDIDIRVCLRDIGCHCDRFLSNILTQPWGEIRNEVRYDVSVYTRLLRAQYSFHSPSCVEKLSKKWRKMRMKYMRRLEVHVTYIHCFFPESSCVTTGKKYSSWKISIILNWENSRLPVPSLQISKFHPAALRVAALLQTKKVLTYGSISYSEQECQPPRYNKFTCLIFSTVLESIKFACLIIRRELADWIRGRGCAQRDLALPLPVRVS